MTNPRHLYLIDSITQITPVLDCSELGDPVGQSVFDLVRKLGGQMPIR